MSAHGLRILVTGAAGFIGKNLVLRLNELPGITVSTWLRGEDEARLTERIETVDAVIHLAGENRPADEAAFDQVNAALTARLCDAIRKKRIDTGRSTQLIFASSTQAQLDNPYGRSKRAAEQAIQGLADASDNPCVVFRLPGVFGKWCRPHYNSVVATFCHNLARGLPIQVNDPEKGIRLVHVDDVVNAMLQALQAPRAGFVQATVQPEYTITLRELADQISAFADCRSSLMSERVGTGLIRALYATYVSYLPNDRFSYDVPQNADPRGVFVEMLKTPDAGQFSYFTAHPGVTRGGHYHHTKTEKFLVVKGEALFRFRNLITDERVELRAHGSQPRVVDTIPGWVHDITNVGHDELVVMLWANEIFDRQHPDTIASRV